MVSASGIVVGGHGGMVEREKLLRAKVLAVGPGKLHESGERIPCDCRPGQTVLVPRKFIGDGDEAIGSAKDVEYHLIREDKCILEMTE